MVFLIIKTMKIYTDGGCEPNPEIRCWAFVCTDPYTEVSGYEATETTSNRMELTAIIKAAEWARSIGVTDIRIVSDSQYCVKGFNEWMRNWAKKGWMKKSAGIGMVEVKNVDLWKKMWQLKSVIQLEWIKGHNGNQYNEVADQLVRNEYEKTFGGEMQH